MKDSEKQLQMHQHSEKSIQDINQEQLETIFGGASPVISTGSAVARVLRRTKSLPARLGSISNTSSRQPSPSRSPSSTGIWQSPPHPSTFGRSLTSSSSSGTVGSQNSPSSVLNG